jgi:hypothetical protein
MRMYRHLRILESNYGRTSGWYVETEGRRVALLTDCRWEDMFWVSYRLQLLTAEPELFSDEFWDRCEKLVFRNCKFGEVAPYAFPALRAGSAVRETGRVLMRGLYLVVRCYPWDCLLLWGRGLGKRTWT